MLSESKKGEKPRRPGGGKSEYGRELINKQKVRYSYGISEKQFSNYVKQAVAKTSANPGDYLFESLESRLDNVVYRLNFAPSRAGARQMVSHGHISVNGKRVTIPSYQVTMDDVVSIREGSRKKPLFSTLDQKLKGYNPPSWLKLNSEAGEAKVQGKPKAEVVPFDLNSVIGFYSR